MGIQEDKFPMLLQAEHTNISHLGTATHQDLGIIKEKSTSCHSHHPPDDRLNAHRKSSSTAQVNMLSKMFKTYSKDFKK